MKRVGKSTIAAVILVLALAGVVMFSEYTAFGSQPTDGERSRFEQSPQYDATKSRFDNPDPAITKAMEEFSWGPVDLFRWLFVDGGRSPKTPLPQMKPDMRLFSAAADTRAIWLGHSSILMRMSGKTILIDPMFGEHASPVPFTVSRFQDSILSLHELPLVDYIVISHDHYDHLDMKTIKHFRDKKTLFLVPLGVGGHLRGWGIDESRITEFDWWEGKRLGGIEFVAAPANHFSGRTATSRNTTLWASWVIRDGSSNIYYSGDSGYGDHFKEIGNRFGPFDIAFIETGQYNIQWPEVHMMPDESAQAYHDLGAKLFVPIHWGMFVLSNHTWSEPPAQISRLAEEQEINLSIPRIGEVVVPGESKHATIWWE